VPSTTLQLPYLKAVIEESMRCYPSAPGALNRTLDETTIIDGTILAAQTNVSVANNSANHSVAHFRNPDSIVPERWLGDEDYADDMHDAFHPFSLGPRNCIGRR